MHFLLAEYSCYFMYTEQHLYCMYIKLILNSQVAAAPLEQLHLVFLATLCI